MLLITVVGLCFGVSLLAVKLEYSVALGAFLIGAIIAEARQIAKIEALTHPVRDLFSAVLYAGPYAGLGGMSAGLWRGLVKWRTAEEIEVWTPRRRRSLEVTDPLNTLGIAIEVKSRRTFTRQDWKGIPTVPIPQIVMWLRFLVGLVNEALWVSVV